MGAAELLNLDPLAYGEISMVGGKFEASFRGRTLSLTYRAFVILYCLLSKPGQVVSREVLLEAVDGDITIIDRNIDVHICSLRKKMRNGRHLIQTIRGLGYRLKETSRI